MEDLPQWGFKIQQYSYGDFCPTLREYKKKKYGFVMKIVKLNFRWFDLRTHKTEVVLKEIEASASGNSRVEGISEVSIL